MSAQRFKVTLSSNDARNRATTEVLDQGGIDYQVIPAPQDIAGFRSLPKVEADGKALTSYDPPALRQFLVEHGAHFEDS